MRSLAGRHAVLRLFVVWVVTAVTLFVLSSLIPEIDIPGWGSAFATAALIGLLNAVVWPLFVRLALPITVLTLGVAALLLNGFIVWMASSIVDGFGVGVLWGIVVAFVLTVVNTVVTSLLGIDDEDFYYRNVIQRAATRQGATSSDVPGVVFLEIDGLAHEVVVRATQRQHADGCPMAARRIAPSHPVGDGLVVADGCLPGRAAARQQRRLAGVSLVGERAQPTNRHEPSQGRRRAGASSFERTRPVARRRRQPGEHPLGRRETQPADYEHGAEARSTRTHRSGLLRLLRQPLQHHENRRVRPGRYCSGALLRRPAAPARHPPTDQAHANLRARALVGYGDSARPPGVGDHRRSLRRPASRLHNLSCL